MEVEVEIPNEAGIPIEAVAAVGPEADASLVATRSEGKDTTICTVRFTARPGTRGMLYAMVDFRSRTGSKAIAFIGRVE